MTDITVITKQQEENALDLLKAIDSVASVAEETSASTEESASAAEEQAASMEDDFITGSKTQSNCQSTQNE